MGINRYSRNLNIRESRPTVLPIPYEAMYNSLQAKQAQYDAAEQLELQTKAQVGALSSPIKDHDNWLIDFKKRYTEEALELHNTYPDKGSPSYKAKLNNLINKYASDPNLSIIDKSSQDYLEGRKIAYKQMSEGKYSRIADIPTLKFKGVNPDGTLNRYVFSGLREKKDWKKMIQDVIDKTPESGYIQKVEDPTTGRTIEKGWEGKHKNVILNGLTSAFMNDQEALLDAMDESGMTPKEFEKFLHNTSILNQSQKTKYSSTWNADMLRFNKENEIIQESAFDGGKVLPDPKHSELLDTHINEKGELVPTSSNTVTKGPKGYPSFGGFFDKSIENTEAKLKEKGVPLDSLYAAAKKLGISKQEMLKRYKVVNNSAQNWSYTPPYDSKERVKLASEIKSVLSTSKVYDEKGNIVPVSEGSWFSRDNATSISKNIENDNFEIIGDLPPNNRFGSHTTAITLFEDGRERKYFVAREKPDPTDIKDLWKNQEHQLYSGMLSGNVIQKIDNYIGYGKNGKLTNFGPAKITMLPPLEGENGQRKIEFLNAEK